MKRSLVCALLTAALSCGTTAFAQMYGSSAQSGGTQVGVSQSGSPAQRVRRPDDSLQQLTEALNLTSDQQKKIKPMLDSESQQMQALRADTSLAPQDRRSKSKAVHQSTREQIKSVLTPEQQQKFAQMGPAGGMRHQGNSIPPPQ